ncbi:MAG: hypothetical protein J6J86_04850 [Lachnospiraceae bacterium]|nr:hypothetical protein [Lachnospiraceae bacterium]
MFEKMLEEKSKVSIENGEWVIKKFSETNKCGDIGRNDLIRRQDAVRLLGEMNIKLSEVYDQGKEKNPQLANELLEATKVLSYAMWGIRELDAVE